MCNNILLPGIPEMSNENCSAIREVAIKLLKDQMRILPEQVDSMTIDRIHQIGKNQENKTQATVINVLLSENKELILSHKKYFRGTDYEVSSQFHPEASAKHEVLKTYTDTEVPERQEESANDKLLKERNSCTMSLMPHITIMLMMWRKLPGTMTCPISIRLILC